MNSELPVWILLSAPAAALLGAVVGSGATLLASWLQQKNDNRRQYRQYHLQLVETELKPVIELIDKLVEYSLQLKSGFEKYPTVDRLPSLSDTEWDRVNKIREETERMISELVLSSNAAYVYASSLSNQIADAAISAYEEGAELVTLASREWQQGMPSENEEAYQKTIREKTLSVLSKSAEARRVIREFKLEIAKSL